MSISLSPAEFPVDRVMRGEYLENLPREDAAEMLHASRDQSLDDAEDTLREESEYWHGMTVVDADWLLASE